MSKVPGKTSAESTDSVYWCERQLTVVNRWGLLHNFLVSLWSSQCHKINFHIWNTIKNTSFESSSKDPSTNISYKFNLISICM